MAALSNDTKLAYKYINLLLSWFSTYDVYYCAIFKLNLYLYIDVHLTLDMFSVREEDDNCVYVYCDLSKLKVTEDDLSVVDNNNGKTMPYDYTKHGGKFHPTITVVENKPIVVFAFNRYTRIARSFKYVIGRKGVVTGNEYVNRYNVIVDDWNSMRDYVHDLEFITVLPEMIECIVGIKGIGV